MSLAAFIDANIPIYAAGREHPLKEPCAATLRLVAENPNAFVTDAEVLQELMHYYLARNRWVLGREVLRNFGLVMVGRVEAVYPEDILAAAEMAGYDPGVSSRDLVHAAVMQRLGTGVIISADTDFDRLSGISRLDPARIGEWGQSVQLRGEF